MARELPVVSTTLAGVREAVVDGECGLLVEPGDATALANALERLLGDGGLRLRLGARARARVAERFQRGTTLPAVHAALADAGLVPAEATPARAPRGTRAKSLTAA
jgi:glycosyltransferase involved in cell wall biosynthesis